MAVVWNVGGSGNRQDALPPVPDSGVSQPILDTDTSGPMSSNVQFPNHRPHRGGQDREADFMPTGCEPEGRSTDCYDSGATTGGDESVFKGAPNTGVKGGPA